MNTRFTFICLVMTTLSCVFFISSWLSYLPFDVGENFPNCVAGRLGFGGAAAGALSLGGTSTIFVVAHDNENGLSTWSERADGHFCGFSFPHLPYMAQPSGFGLRLSLETLAWDCPYWLMATAWFLTFVKLNGGIRFSVSQVVVATTAIGYALALIVSRVALPLVVLMNLLTVAWFIVAFFSYISHMLSHHSATFIRPKIVADSATGI